MRYNLIPIMRWTTQWNVHLYPKCCHGQLLKTTTREVACINMTHYSSQTDKKTKYDLVDIQTEIKRLNGIKNNASLYMKKLNRTKIQKLNILKIEYEVLKAEGSQVPEEMTDYDWLGLLPRSLEERKEYYLEIILYQEQFRNLDKLLQLHTLEFQEMERYTRGNRSDSPFYYDGPVHFQYRVQALQQQNAFNGWKFGRQVVLEFDGRALLTFREDVKNIITKNNQHPEPFCLNLTNCSYSKDPRLLKQIDSIKNKNAFINFHEDKTTKVFPKERLVYLTPGSRNKFHFSEDDIPIFCSQNPEYSDVIVNMAEEQGVRHANLNMDRYIRKEYRTVWNKRLNAQQSFSVLQDMNYRGDWVEAYMNNIPITVRTKVSTPKDVFDTVGQLKDKLYTDT